MDPPTSTPGERCSARRAARPLPRAPGDLRPTDVVGAFFLAGALFLVLAAACAIWQSFEPWTWGRWLALHLAFVGGVSQLVLGASQFFAGAFLATDPPPRVLVRGQLITWNLGTVLLAVAVPTGGTGLLWLAVLLLVVGLGLWFLSIFTLRRKSLSRAPWATRWYLACAAFFGTGMIFGSLMAVGASWSHGYLLGAHMSLNLAGFFGTAIVGTLHTFYPSLTQTQLRFPGLQRVSFFAWSAGVVALAIGYAWSLDGLAIGGWLALTGGAGTLLVNLIACRLRPGGELSLAARVVGAAQPLLLAGLLVISVTAIADGPMLALSGSTRVAAGSLLVAGWIGLTVLGSLLHLLAVVVRVRGFSKSMPKARARIDTAVAVTAMVAVAALAASQFAELSGPDDLARFLVLAVYAYLGARVVLLVRRVVVGARPQI